MSETLSKVKNWVEQIVIGQNLCPFAKRPYEADQLKISICEGPAMTHFLDELDLFQMSPAQQVSNQLLIFPNEAQDFYQFYDFFCECEDAIDDLEVSDLFQIVCFHPKFHFEGADPNERANWVNRSPYPIIHLLRFEEVELALSNKEEAEAISQRNSDHLENMSESDWNHFLSHFN